MTHHPFDSSELGRVDEDLDRIAERLETYAASAGGEPPRNLSARIRAAVDAHAARRRPRAAFMAALRGPARSVAATGAVALALAGVIVVGQLAEQARDQAGDSPSPSVTASPRPTPTPSPSATPSPSPSPSTSPSPSLTPTEPPGPSAPEPSPSATGELETETPHPSGSDNSGPGGGGESSGPGGGGSSGSGSGSGGDDPP